MKNLLIMQENEFSGTISMYLSTMQPLCTRADKLVTSRGDWGKMIHFFETFFPAFMTGYILLLLDVLYTVEYLLQLGRKKYRHKVTFMLETNHSK